MNLETIMQYVELYGYIVILFVLFFGIVGIPAPEETFMVFIGAIVAQQHLQFIPTVIAALLGANIGMFIAYLIGKNLGHSLVQRFGNIVRITPERWETMQQKFSQFNNKILVVAYFFPGLRQVSPYMSGVRKLPLTTFFSFSFFGSSLWVMTYMTIGYYFGDFIGLKYLSLFALLGFLIFSGFLVWKGWATPTHKKVSS